MKLKSYFSGSVEEAVGMARKELGEDALLMNARPSTPETRHLGAYEVVFAAAHAPAESSILRAPRDVSQDISQMRREIERLARCLGPRVAAGDSPESGVYAQLVANEIDPLIAQAVNRGAALEEFFEVDSTLGCHGTGRAIVALIGPPGVGKTTTLVKLAAHFGVGSRRPTQILSADVFRIAAAEQLRSLAAILGVGCDVAETPAALVRALEEHRSKELIFIDTPGLARSEMQDAADLAQMIATHPEIDTHLVLSASMKPVDLTRVIEQYAAFQPKKLLFTRVDETECFGAMINQASRRSLPVSFLTSGQQIPDDLEPATKARLIELATGRNSMGATA